MFFFKGKEKGCSIATNWRVDGSWRIGLFGYSIWDLFFVGWLLSTASKLYLKDMHWPIDTSSQPFNIARENLRCVNAFPVGKLRIFRPAMLDVTHDFEMSKHLLWQSVPLSPKLHFSEPFWNHLEIFEMFLQNTFTFHSSCKYFSIASRVTISLVKSLVDQFNGCFWFP